MTITATPWDALLAASTVRVIRLVDIYEADGFTPFCLNANVIDGTITVDNSRDERRTMDLLLDGTQLARDLIIGPEQLWYDKVVKVYRGLYIEDNVEGALVAQIGTFLTDKIEQPHFPFQIRLSGRDFTKKLLLDKFAGATTFAAATPVEDAIRGIIIAAGITDYGIPVTGQVLGVDFAYELEVTRWKAVKDIATAFSYDTFFSAEGKFIMQPFIDPLLAPTIYSFHTGVNGNLATYDKSASDAEIFNHIVVIGQTNDRLPVCGSAENNEPTSPTRILGKLGRRVKKYESSLVTTPDQAIALAQAILKVAALESYEVRMDSLVVPWLDVNTAVEFHPRAGADTSGPARFLLTNLNIPMKLGTMAATAKRITLVGTDPLAVFMRGTWGRLIGHVDATVIGGIPSLHGDWGPLTGSVTATVDHVGGPTLTGSWGPLTGSVTATVSSAGGGGTITHGRQMNATNTGFTAWFDATIGHNLTLANLAVHAGGTITTNGQTYYAKDFASGLRVTGNNNTFRGFRIHTDGGDEASRAIYDSGIGNTYEYGTIVPTAGHGYGFGLLNDGGAVTFRRMNVSGCGNLTSLYAGPAHIYQNYYHDAGNVTTPADHTDGCECYGGDDHVVEDNRVDCKVAHPPADGTVSPFNCAPWGGNILRRLKIRRNFIDGGNNHVLVDAQSPTPEPGGVIDLQVYDNDMGGHTTPSIFGAYAALQNHDVGRAVVTTIPPAGSTDIYWSNNTWEETQTPPPLVPNNDGLPVIV